MYLSPVPTSYAQCFIERQRLVPPQTDMFRVIDGKAEGYPDIFVDYFAGRLLVSTRDTALPKSLAQEIQQVATTGVPVFLKHLEQQDKEAPVQIAGPELPVRFVGLENGLSYWIDMSAGYSQGIFLDQRNNRKRIRDLVRPGDTILNTFSYTGAFSICAASAGATVTTLDLAQPCLDWAKENMGLNGINPEDHFFCKGDTLHWLDRFARQGRQFQGIILDPPTFSRDKQGKVWRVERDYGTLLEKAARCLAPDGWIFCSTNCRKLSHKNFRSIAMTAVPGTRIESGMMPPDFTGEPYLKSLFIFNQGH